MYYVRFMAGQDYLKVVGEWVKLFFGLFAGILNLKAFDAQPLIDELNGLNEVQERAKQRRKDATAVFRAVLKEALKMARGIALTLEGFFINHGKDHAVEPIPLFPSNGSFDAKVSFVEAIFELVDENPDVPGIDRPAFAQKIQAVFAARKVRLDALLEMKAATDTLDAKRQAAMGAAVAWVEILSGLAKLTGNTTVLKHAPRLPRARGPRDTAPPEAAAAVEQPLTATHTSTDHPQG